MKPDLEAIKARAEAADKGPWFHKNYDECLIKPHVIRCPDEIRTRTVCTPPHSNPKTEANMVFIAHARQDIPDLLTLVEQQQAEIEKWKNYGKDDLRLMVSDLTEDCQLMSAEITRLKAALERASRSIEMLILAVVGSGYYEFTDAQIEFAITICDKHDRLGSENIFDEAMKALAQIKSAQEPAKKQEAHD